MKTNRKRSHWNRGKDAVRLLLAGAVAFAAVVAASGPAVRAEPAHGQTTATDVVLVHGAWADGSGWGAVIERLQKAKYQVTAVQLALESLDDDVALQNAPTLLVAHSYGGAVVTQLGTDAPNVVGIVYESAFAPAEGETLKGLTGTPPAPAGAVAIRPDKRGFLWLDPDGFVKYFASDVAPAKARVMAAAQKPIAAAVLGGEEKFGPPAWKSFPTWYLISEKDQMLPPAAQQMFSKCMGATVSSIAAATSSWCPTPTRSRPSSSRPPARSRPTPRISPSRRPSGTINSIRMRVTADGRAPYPGR
jgi:pimeloyl-ACP methyl ester carboxylesterase